MYLSDVKNQWFSLKKGLPGDQRVEGQNSLLVCMPVCLFSDGKQHYK